MMKKILALAAMAAMALPAAAQVSVTSTAAYTQSFDSLATTGVGNALTLTGWSLYKNDLSAVTTYGVGTSTTTSGGFFSFGGSANPGDRALGSIATNGFTGNNPAVQYMALALKNDSGNAFTGFTLKYTGEQWRNGGNINPQSFVVEYGYGTTFASVGTWAAAGSAFNFTSTVNLASSSANSASPLATVSGIGGTVTSAWSAGNTLWIRWKDLNDVGTEHNMAIDDVSIAAIPAVPEPGTTAMLLAGLAAVGFVARRRRQHGA